MKKNLIFCTTYNCFIVWKTSFLLKLNERRSLAFLDRFVHKSSEHKLLTREQLGYIEKCVRISAPLFLSERKNAELLCSLSYYFGDIRKEQRSVEGFDSLNDCLGEISREAFRVNPTWFVYQGKGDSFVYTEGR